MWRPDDTCRVVDVTPEILTSVNLSPVRDG